ncbi:50S ribosomal protein L19e [Thermoplasmatales archaeon SW_10_69_26]|nr:MAG: 50S ribosomal protein L19e [Thermoplasmatales archaeon SW_10_69_26]
MSDLRVQKRMAAELLDCGENRVWIDPLEQEEVATAITREDIRRLIDQDVIQKKEADGTSRGRARDRDEQREKGRQRGPGSRQGSKGARNPEKDDWKKRIRAIRDQLKTLRDEDYIDSSTYRTYYKRANGGLYDSRRHLLNHLVIDDVLSEDEVEQLKEVEA